MIKKSESERQGLVATLQAALQLVGWQAELVRSALRQAMAERQQRKRAGKRPPRRGS